MEENKTVINVGHGLWVFSNIADAVTTYLATGTIANGVELNPFYSLPLKIAVTIGVPLIINYQYNKNSNTNFRLAVVALYYFVISMTFTIALNTTIMLFLNGGI